MKLFIISDMHGNPGFLDSAGDLIKNADAVIICGDISKDSRRKSAEFILDEIGKNNKNILAVHGNWDGPEVLELLQEKNYSVHADGKIIDGIGFFGAGGSSSSPVRTPTEYLDDELYEFLETGYKKISAASKKIMITHMPAYGLRDRTFLAQRVGSSRIKDFIEHNKTDLIISGHIHEAHGMEKTEYGIAVNPGPFRKGYYINAEIKDEIEISLNRLKHEHHFFTFGKKIK
jgi:Icc-related predicted phosphoesterase